MRDNRLTPNRTVRGARLLFGVPRVFRWLWSFGVRVEPAPGAPVHGEWIVPHGTTRGTILYLHGGGYISCSPGDYRPITAGLAKLAHRRVFVPDYRLAPEHRFPAAVDDAVAAYRWLLDQGVAPAELALVGDSAGGGLALALMVRLRDAGLPLPACAVCFSAWMDLSCSGASVHAHGGRWAPFKPRHLTTAASIYLDGASPQHPEASPMFADLAGLPPMLLQVASSEMLLDDARRVHEKVQAAGGVCRLEIFDHAFHVWQLADGIVPAARAALKQAAGFIADSE